MYDEPTPLAGGAMMYPTGARPSVARKAAPPSAKVRVSESTAFASPGIDINPFPPGENGPRRRAGFVIHSGQMKARTGTRMGNDMYFLGGRTPESRRQSPMQISRNPETIASNSIGSYRIPMGSACFCGNLAESLVPVIRIRESGRPGIHVIFLEPYKGKHKGMRRSRHLVLSRCVFPGRGTSSYERCTKPCKAIIAMRIVPAEMPLVPHD